MDPRSFLQDWMWVGCDLGVEPEVSLLRVMSDVGVMPEVSLIRVKCDIRCGGLLVCAHDFLDAAGHMA